MSPVQHKPTIAVSIGDPAGIGPEVTVKALLDPELRGAARWRVVGEEWIIKDAMQHAGTIPYESAQKVADITEHADCVVLSAGQLQPVERTYGKLSAACGRAGLEYVRMATNLCLAGHADAMVTAPLNKEAVALTGQLFCGHTEFIAELCDIDESRMLLVNDKLCVAHVSTHISLRDATRLNESRIVKTIELAHEAYMQLR